MGTGSFNSDLPQNIEIEIESNVIANALLKSPEFINALAIAVRNILTKDVRRMGNIFSNTAQTPLNNQTIPPTTILNSNQAKWLS